MLLEEQLFGEKMHRNKHFNYDNQFVHKKQIISSTVDVFARKEKKID